MGLPFLTFLTWRSQGLLQHLQERVPGLRAFLVGGLVAAALGLAVNDSGVAIPAMMFGVALPYCDLPRHPDRGPSAGGRGRGRAGSRVAPAAGAGAGGAASRRRSTRPGTAGNHPTAVAGNVRVPGGTSSAGVR